MTRIDSDKFWLAAVIIVWAVSIAVVVFALMEKK